MDNLALILQEAVSNRAELKRRGAKAWEIVNSAFTPDRVYRQFFDAILPNRAEGVAG